MGCGATIFGGFDFVVVNLIVLRSWRGCDYFPSAVLAIAGEGLRFRTEVMRKTVAGSRTNRRTSPRANCGAHVGAGSFFGGALLQRWRWEVFVNMVKESPAA